MISVRFQLKSAPCSRNASARRCVEIVPATDRESRRNHTERGICGSRLKSHRPRSDGPTRTPPINPHPLIRRRCESESVRVCALVREKPRAIRFPFGSAVLPAMRSRAQDIIMNEMYRAGAGDDVENVTSSPSMQIAGEIELDFAEIPAISTTRPNNTTIYNEEIQPLCAKCSPRLGKSQPSDDPHKPPVARIPTVRHKHTVISCAHRPLQHKCCNLSKQ